VAVRKDYFGAAAAAGVTVTDAAVFDADAVLALLAGIYAVKGS